MMPITDLGGVWGVFRVEVTQPQADGFETPTVKARAKKRRGPKEPNPVSTSRISLLLPCSELGWVPILLVMPALKAASQKLCHSIWLKPSRMLRSSRAGSNERLSAVGGDGPTRTRPSAGRGRSECPMERGEGAGPRYSLVRCAKAPKGCSGPGCPTSQAGGTGPDRATPATSRDNSERADSLLGQMLCSRRHVSQAEIGISIVAMKESTTGRLSLFSSVVRSTLLPADVESLAPQSNTESPEARLSDEGTGATAAEPGRARPMASKKKSG